MGLETDDVDAAVNVGVLGGVAAVATLRGMESFKKEQQQQQQRIRHDTTRHDTLQPRLCFAPMSCHPSTHPSNPDVHFGRAAKTCHFTSSTESSTARHDGCPTASVSRRIVASRLKRARGWDDVAVMLLNAARRKSARRGGQA